MMSAGDMQGIMQPLRIAGFALQMWHRSTRPKREKQTELTSEHITIEAARDPICIASVYINDQFYSGEEFTNLFPQSIQIELPPIRSIDHEIAVKPGA